MKKWRPIISLILRALIPAFALNGVLLTLLTGTLSWRVFLYFTIQSNLFVSVVAIIGFIVLLIEVVTKKSSNHRWLNILQLMSLVAMTLTGLVFCCVLAPTLKSGAWGLENLFTHVIAPALTIIEFLFSSRHPSFHEKEALYSLIPPLGYLFFALIGYACKLDFGSGNHYPYFFLNLDSPAGFFSFSNISPYYMGTFYWIIVLLMVILFLSYLFRFLSNLINRERFSTVLCYIHKNDKYLLMLRNKEKNDINHDKWIGVGGHIEKGETPIQTLLREVKEETNLDLLTYEKRGVITFKNEDTLETMHVFTSHEFTGHVSTCDEGTLKWIDKDQILKLSLWEGDRVFLPKLLKDEPYFVLEFIYKGERLIKVIQGKKPAE